MAFAAFGAGVPLISDGTAEPRRQSQASRARALVCGFDLREALGAAVCGLVIGATIALGARAYGFERPVTPLYLPLFVQTSAPALPLVQRTPTAIDERLLAPMSFTMLSDGVIMGEGRIDAGALPRLKAQFDAFPDIRRVSLNSPGGSLQTAIAIALLLRQRGVDTEVADTAQCASSCPLLFAGGVHRYAGRRAAIGVHQFFGDPAQATDTAQTLYDAQLTAAHISRHLGRLGVEPALWLHALETPPQTLYNFSADEMLRYRLVTDVRAPGVRTALGVAMSEPAS